MLSLVVFAAVAAGPRPISDPERAAVSVVARYLASGPEAMPLALAREEIAVRMGPRENATWTLRTASEGVAFQVRWPSGFEDGVLFRMRGNTVESITTLGEPNVGRASARPTGGGRAEARPTLVILAVLCAVVAIGTRRFRLVFLAAAAAFGVV